MLQKNKTSVFVGLSGGVDSSVSAALLKDQGYDVTGVFIKTWHPEFLPCTWRQERLDAMRVAAHLDIPFKTYDFEEIYKRDVADQMIAEYARGNTPNPDILCNQHVKFGAFLEKARQEGADCIATGHYAQQKEASGEVKMLSGADPEKDQTYFLWTLGQNELASTLFPVGELEKSEVRKKAKKYHLPTASKKDSQGICFLGNINMKEFLKRYLDVEPGNILSENGEVIGWHDGALLYTLGQRHGFEITEGGIDKKPRYIIKKDLEANTLTVSPEPERTKKGSTLSVTNINWISGEQPEEGAELSARFRHRQPLFNVRVEAVKREQLEVTPTEFDVTKNAASGQSLVLYDGRKCLGGGILV